ncbi:hypothetical protein MCHI_004023 [Candidatus Magnetoovum chiemensis]|nr:hypothetical protein MCHI_004023 [Candidatus Magnetoovum chiemensis]
MCLPRALSITVDCSESRRAGKISKSAPHPKRKVLLPVDSACQQASNSSLTGNTAQPLRGK